MEDQALLQIENLLDVKRYEEATRRCLERLIANPESVELLSALARSFIYANNLHDADLTSVKLISIAPLFAHGYYLRSVILHRQKFFDAELRMAKKAVQLEPEEPLYLYRLAEAQLQSGLISCAKISADLAVKLEPNGKDTLSLLGDIELALKKYACAEQHYRAALQQSPEDISLLNQLAVSLWSQKRQKEALDIFFNALKKDAANPDLQDNTFKLIQQYLDKNTLVGRRKKAFLELPVPMQIFYKDHRQRRCLFDRHSNFTIALFWLVILAVLAWVIGLAS